MGVSVHNNCPANREGNCAFSNFNEYCHCHWSIDNCFKSHGGHNPQICEYKSHGKTIRVVIHVTEDDWEFGESRYENGFNQTRLKEVYGDPI